MEYIVCLVGMAFCFHIMQISYKNTKEMKSKIIESNLKLYAPNFEKSVVKPKEFFFMQ